MDSCGNHYWWIPLWSSGHVGLHTPCINYLCPDKRVHRVQDQGKELRPKNEENLKILRKTSHIIVRSFFMQVNKKL